MTDDPPATVGDLDDPDRGLWVKSTQFGQGRIVHTNADCYKLDGEGVSTKARHEHIETAVCAFCTDTAASEGGSGPQTAAQIKGAWADDD